MTIIKIKRQQNADIYDLVSYKKGENNDIG